MSNEREILYPFAIDTIRKRHPASILDVGTGTSAFPLIVNQCGYAVTAIDSYGGYWPGGLQNIYFKVVNYDITKNASATCFDLITCLHVLSHIENYQQAITNMKLMLNPGGCIVFGTPYNEHLGVANAYDMPDAGYGHNAPYKCRIFCAADIQHFGCRIVEQHYWKIFTGRLWTQGERLAPTREVSKHELHHFSTMILEI